ncbi:MAG: hypothetical protein IKA02_04115 [Clostridia bacterium]|nr:hypothetical protein [Clostridia bacterium]
MKNGFIENLYKNAGYYCVGLISLCYIASSLILISKTGRSVCEIIGTGFISMVVGSLINGSFRSIGIRRGEENEKTVETLSDHSKTVEEISPYIDTLDEFCDRENKMAKKRIRTKILASVGLKYQDCFDEDGTLIKFDLTELDKTRQKDKKVKNAYEKAKNLKIKELTPDSLTTEGGNEENPFDFGKSKSSYNKNRSFSDVLVRVIMAVIFGYFGVTLVSEVNFATIIWNTLQIVMYVSSGVVGMYSTYMWVVNDYRQGVIKKIEYLKRFKIFAEQKNIVSVDK